MILKFLLAQSFVLSLICAIGFAAIAIMVIGQQNIVGFDMKWITLIQGRESATLTQIMKFFTFIGAGIPITVITFLIAVVLYVVLQYRWQLIFFISVVVGSGFLNLVLKLMFHRARPTAHRIVEANGFSFPSGHSMAAFTLYGVLCFLLWKHAHRPFDRSVLILLGSIMIITIGVSRIYLGVHYPSDVVGGFLASGSWLAFSIGTYQNFIHKKASRVKLGRKI